MKITECNSKIIPLINSRVNLYFRTWDSGEVYNRLLSTDILTIAQHDDINPLLDVGDCQFYLFRISEIDNNNIYVWRVV